MPKWTDTQCAAIEERGRNLLINAAAGSGKTAVLTERIAQLVCEGTDIERFLVVTFTDAAAAQMKQRISGRLTQAAQQQADGAAATRLRAQALAVEHANISTLHAFCLYILRRNFHRLGLDPAFSTADALLGDMLLREAFLEAAEDSFARNDEGTLALLTAFSGDQEKLMDEARRLHAFLFAQAKPWVWLDDAAHAYESGPPDAVLRELMAQGKMEVSIQLERLKQARALTPPAYTGVLSILDDDSTQLGALTLKGDWQTFCARLAAISFQRFGKWPKDTEEDRKSQVKGLRDQALKAVSLMQKHYDQTMLALEGERMCALSPAVHALCAFVRQADDMYASLKRERSVVDFSDMEHMALRALEFEDVQSALRNRYRYVFVDEYQDSSRIQEQLIASVCGTDNLFLVGDVKQSIYRFRQAVPELFLEKAQAYTGLPGAPGAQIGLTTNFRSELPVIQAVNGVFTRIMTPNVGEMAYDETVALRCADEHAPITELAGCELHAVSLDPVGLADEDTQDDEEEEQPLTAAQAEARLAAQRIHALMRETLYKEDGKDRPLRYSDFVVLLRAHRNTGEIWAQTLAAAGVPAYVQLTGGYFEAVEVRVFLNLLRVIDNRQQDIPLLSVLRSPVFNFEEEQLTRIKMIYPAETFFESLLACAQHDGGAPEQTFNVLAHWKREATLNPLGEYLAWLLEHSGLYEYMGALPGGSDRQANLDALLARAREYEVAGGACDLWSFIAHMDSAADTMQMGAAQAGAADVVRILSIHKSKGLEYPVVILAGLNKRFFRKDEQGPVLLDSELGIGVRLNAGGIRRDTLLRRAAAGRQRAKSLAEEMRILYVGMTRARSRLILIGSGKNIAESVHEANTREVTPAYCANARSFMDWLLPVAAQDRAFSLFLHKRAPAFAQAEPTGEPDASQQALLSVLTKRFAWRYPYPEAATIPSKLSVSELLHAREVSLRDPPAFTQRDARLNAAQRGSALHIALREITFPACAPAEIPAFVAQELERMQFAGLLSRRQADALTQQDIAWFLASDLCRRMRISPRVERELEFSAELPAHMLIDTQSDEPVLLQGVLDCCFLEQDEWVLLDYKTDRVPPDSSPEQAASLHAPQLALYAQALTRLTGRPVREVCVVMLRAQQIVKV